MCFEQELLPFLGENSKAIRVVFWKIYAATQEFYATAGLSGPAKYQLWKESRATNQNLKGKRSLKALNEEDLERLWLPLVVYANTDQQETTRLGMDWEWSTSVSVLREGNFARSDLTVFDEIEIFKGEENNLVKEQAYTHELSSSVFTSWTNIRSTHRWDYLHIICALSTRNAPEGFCSRNCWTGSGDFENEPAP